MKKILTSPGKKKRESRLGGGGEQKKYRKKNPESQIHADSLLGEKKNANPADLKLGKTVCPNMRERRRN